MGFFLKKNMTEHPYIANTITTFRLFVFCATAKYKCHDGTVQINKRTIP